jgi:hypothetical protein
MVDEKEKQASQKEKIFACENFEKKRSRNKSLQFVTVINFVASLRKPKSLQTANTAILSQPFPC